MKKQDKKSVIESLSKELKEAKSVSFIDFAGMNIVASQDLKKRLKDAKGKMVVAKNTLIKLASKEAKLPQDLTKDDILKGQTAVVIANDDPVSPIQIVGKMASEGSTVKFKGGYLDGLFQDKDAMVAISKLPSKEILVGQTVSNIAGPMYMLISNLQATVQELLGTLAAKVG